MILFVGDKPSPKMRPNALPFQGAACEKRLMEWIKQIGIQPHYIINSAECSYMANMFNHCGAPIIALGNNASKALENIAHFKLPHPSGRNRQINDKAFIDQRLADCIKYIQSFN